MSVKVLLADDHRIVRDGLRSLLEQQGDVDVVWEAQNGRDAVELAGNMSPDVVVMDITMPDLNGIEATRRILATNPSTHVIALSVHSDYRYVLEMFKAGASGYLIKDCAFEELVQAIRTVAKNRKYLSPAIANVVIEACLRLASKSDSSVYRVLTSRQREVLQLLGEGYSTKNISARLGMSHKTVESHRRQIMNRLGIHNIADLTKYAVREGLTSLET